MTRKESQIKRWADFIIPAVFYGELELGKREPGLLESIRGMEGESAKKAYDEYVRKIAEIIVEETYNK